MAHSVHGLSVFLESCSRSLCVSRSLLQLFYFKDCELHDSKQVSDGNAILEVLQSVCMYSSAECASYQNIASFAV